MRSAAEEEAEAEAEREAEAGNSIELKCYASSPYRSSASISTERHVLEGCAADTTWGGGLEGQGNKEGVSC
jgi:hypothetical protein